ENFAEVFVVLSLDVKGTGVTAVVGRARDYEPRRAIDRRLVAALAGRFEHGADWRKVDRLPSRLALLPLLFASLGNLGRHPAHRGDLRFRQGAILVQLHLHLVQEACPSPTLCLMQEWRDVGVLSVERGTRIREFLGLTRRPRRPRRPRL